MADAMLLLRDKLYYLSVFEDGYDLWEHKSERECYKSSFEEVGAGALQPDKEGIISSFVPATE